MAIGARIKHYRNKAGLTLEQLAERSGVELGTISALENRDSSRSKYASALAAALGLTVEQLEDETTEYSPSAPAEIPRDANFAPASLGAHRVPLISYVQAGLWTAVTDPYPPGEAADWLLTDLALSGGAFALEIVGNSMLPDFRPGDRVIIDPAIAPRPGDFVVAKNGDEEATFKKYRPRGVSERGDLVFELLPLNDDYPTLRSDTSPIRIIGVMVEHRKYRRP